MESVAKLRTDISERSLVLARHTANQAILAEVFFFAVRKSEDIRLSLFLERVSNRCSA